MLLFDCSDLAMLADVEGGEEKILFSPLKATINLAHGSGGNPVYGAR